jgi:hypothetical protein
MKRIAVLSLGLLSLGLFLYAQDGPRQNRRGCPGFDEFQEISFEKLILSGTLELNRGIIVLKSGDEIWQLPGLLRYAGFIDGLKEGAAVSLEGWGIRTPRLEEADGIFRVSKLTLDGKDYEVGPAEPQVAWGPGPGPDRLKGPGLREFHRRMGPMMRPGNPGRGPRRLPGIRPRSAPEES